MPSWMPRESGGCRNGNAAMSPSPIEIICRMTAARFGAQDLGVGEGRPLLEVLLRVEPDRDPVAGAPGAPGALVGAGLADRLDRQPLHLRPHAVARDARGAGVDHVLDARHGQRGLGDVGGEHDAAPDAGLPLGVEHPVLIGRRSAARRAARTSVPVAGAGTAADGVLGIPDLVLAAERTPARRPDASRPSSTSASTMPVQVVAVVAGPVVVGVVEPSPPGLGRPGVGTGSRPGRCARSPRRSGPGCRAASAKCARSSRGRSSRS